MDSRLLFLFSIALAAACGGSAPSADPVLQSAALQGYVYEVDGQTVDRAGIDVRVLETGEIATTDAEGRFAFAGVPAGGVTLEFGSTLISLAQREGPGGGGNGEQNQEQHQEGEQEQERHRHADDEGEDEDGHPHLHGLVVGDRVQVRCAIEDGEVREFFMAGVDRLRAMTFLTRDPDSPDADVKGKVKIESRTDRERFEIEVEHLSAGTAINIYLAAPPAEGEDPDFSFLGSATANTDGEAEIERDTRDGDQLPLGAETVAELEGVLIEVRLDTDDEPLLLSGAVPALPDEWPAPGDGVQAGVRARARVRLEAHEAGLEGHVELRRREQNRNCFEIEAEHLAPGRMVGFFLESAAGSGESVQLATCVANAEGECTFETEDALPLGLEDIAQLAGREVSVREMSQNGPGPILLEATVPVPVAD
jgi:hypothetical protein